MSSSETAELTGRSAGKVAKVIGFRETQPERFAKMTKTLSLGRVGDSEADIGPTVAARVSDDMRYRTGDTPMLTGRI
ncbi:hypothetical protein OG563_42435 [Nocardia vinacea]|uniref:Uncharacterized protein n=1 Tax=Nocardia vinacea TaxID=96468 RepID=A0ABZ1YUV9_9NOCA|nr:hypothetical protein [Nocardia vinacea]